MAPPNADETLMLIGQDLRSGRIEISEYGNNSQAVRVVGEAMPVQTEEIPPQHVAETRGVDPETGEIIEAQQHQKPIDLRIAT